MGVFLVFFLFQEEIPEKHRWTRRKFTQLKLTDETNPIPNFFLSRMKPFQEIFGLLKWMMPDMNTPDGWSDQVSESSLQKKERPVACAVCRLGYAYANSCSVPIQKAF